jgi:predicted dehydrogenase/ribosomal protein S18 acetylase RimI-like enzyme
VRTVYGKEVERVASTSGPLRVGLVAKRALSLAPGLLEAGAQVTAVCELDPALRDRMGEACGVPAARRLADYADLLAAEVDAVVLGTPMQLHAAQAIAALQAGKHVLCEVTAAVSVEECRALAQAGRRAAQQGLVYMMAENYCYLRSNVLVRELVTKGAFGDTYYAEGEYIHDVKHLHHQTDGTPTWRARWQVGVNGCTYPTHSLGPVMQWMGRERIATVSCLGSGVHTDPEHAMDDTVLMLCKLASGRLVRVRLDMMSNRPHAMTNYGLQGTEGAYESGRAPGEPDRIWLRRLGAVRWHDLEELMGELPSWYRAVEQRAAESGHGGGDFFVGWDFIRACRGEIPVPIPLEDALSWTMAGLCSQISIGTGGVPVRVPTLDELLAEDGRRRPQLVMRRPAELGAPAVELPAGYRARRARPEDVEGLARLLNAAFGGWDAARVRAQLLEAPDVRATFVVVDEAERVVACASDRRVPDRFPGAMYLHYVAAHPAHARRGLGRAASAAAIAHAYAEAPCDAVLETDDHRLAAVVTYLRLGFTPEYTDVSHRARWAAVLGALAAHRPGDSGGAGR